MSNKVTICDIAKELGVSITTVTRALNGKGRISEETRKLVYETTKQMGYKPNKVAMSLARKALRFGIIINSRIPEYHNELIKGIKAAQFELADFNVNSDVYVFGLENSRMDALNKMKEIGDTELDGIITCPGSGDYNQIIETLHFKKIPVVTFVEDIPDSKRLFTVRSNGRQAGKMAAELLWWFLKEKNVAIFTAYKDKGIHVEKINGFMEQVKKTPLNVVAIYEHHDDPTIAYHTTDKLLREYPEIDGIYISTANSAMICKKIIELGLGGKIKVVASDIFPELNDYIIKGVVHATIFQDPFNQGRMAFKYLYEHIAEGKQFNSEILINPQIVVESNLEAYRNDSYKNIIYC